MFVQLKSVIQTGLCNVGKRRVVFNPLGLDFIWFIWDHLFKSKPCGDYGYFSLLIFPSSTLTISHFIDMMIL